MKIAWIHLATLPDEKARSLAATALEQGFSHIIVSAGQKERLERLGRFQALVREDTRVSTNGTLVAEWVTLKGKADEDRAAALAATRENVIVSATDWKIIPMENLIARFQAGKARLLAAVGSAQEARTMLTTLEVGTHGVVLTPSRAQDLIDLAALLRSEAPRATLEEATVVRVSDAGLGERVCVDTCSLLRRGEGMLVGSGARMLFLVASESLESEYVAARPFRVNAGAVFSYVMGPGERTHYLSEVHAGLPLLAVDHTGATRVVVTGRAKTETRPLLLFEAEVAGPKGAERGQVMLQNAETIRLTQPDGSTLSVVDVKPGDRILVARFAAARHFGHAIRETLLET